MLRTCAFILLFSGAAVFAQPAEKKPVFEAASIKPPDPNYSGSGWNTSTGRITVRNMTLRQLVMLAYDVKDYQVSGGPKWLDDDRYTIVAKLEDAGQPAPRGKENDARLRLAMQSLLADRFRMAMHTESREMSAYALVVARNGFKLQKSEAAGGSSSSWGSHSGHGTATFKGASMERLAYHLASMLDRPVVDRTGVQGVFDFSLQWSADDAVDPSGPSIFTAIQEQLGLKLEGQKVPMEIIAIDHAEKPDAN
jgi:bla regulator protein blaR1